jgi:hypothetical protein
MVVAGGVLAALVYVSVNYVKSLFPGIDGRVTQGLVFLAGIGSVFLAASTVWAHQNVFGGTPLDHLNFGSKVAAGLLIAPIATIIDRTESAVRNIGTPAEPEPGTVRRAA